MKSILLRKHLGFAAAVILSSPASSATLTVLNTNDNGAGSLRQAIINAAGSGDVIVFAPGVTGTITLTTGELAFSKSLTIAGPGPANLTVSGNSVSRVFNVSTGEITISGLRIADGLVTGNPNALQAGGGILNNSARLTLRNCEISNNRHNGGAAVAGSAIPGQGGGIWHIAGGDAATGGRLLMQNCKVLENTARGGTGAHAAAGSNNPGGTAAPGQGGGLYIFPSSANSVTLEDCEFSGNSAIGGLGGNGDGGGARGRGGPGQGGGVFVEQNTLLVAQRSLFYLNDATGGQLGTGSNTGTSNPADGQGGGIYLNGFGLITGCTLDSNQANGGGGILNTSILGAAGQGGGLFYNFGAVNLDRTTVTDNAASGGHSCNMAATSCVGQGGGIFVRSSAAPLNLTNSTVASNIANGGTAQGGALQGPASGGGIWTEQTLNVTNSTVAFNRSFTDGSNAGGGLFVSSGTTTLRNALIAANAVNVTPNDASGTVAASSSNNLIGAGVGLAGISNGSNGNQIGTSGAPIDAKINPPGFNGGINETCFLQFDSPAINAGNDANAPAQDQRGYSRVGISDIGAFERDGLAPVLRITAISSPAIPIVVDGVGVPNAVHRVQASDDLSPNNFFDFATVTANPAGLLHYEDPAAGVTRRFYRFAFP